MWERRLFSREGGLLSSSTAYSNELVRTFVERQGALRVLLMRRLGDEEEVLDVLQEVFIKALASGQTDQQIINPFNYLRRMAVNLATDRQRDMNRRDHVFKREDILAGKLDLCASDGLTPERYAQDRQRLRMMQEILDDLPEACREAFLLSRCDGLTYDEIGMRLGVSRNMVKKHLSRALAELRAAMPLLK